MNKLLPPNATTLERNLEATTARISDVPAPPALWDPDTCPENLLPWLAWAMAVDGYDSNWPAEVQRAAIKEAKTIHQRKGTVGAVKLALQSLGYGYATMLEGLDAKAYDGSISHDGTFFYGNESTHWARYRLYLQRPITLKQAIHVRRILGAVAPARSKLEGLHFEGVDNIYNGAINYDGNYSYGAL